MKDLGKLTNSEIQISWLTDIKTDDGRCIRKVAVRAPTHSDLIAYPCTKSEEPNFIQKAGATFLDGLIYSDIDTPNKVFVVLGAECEVRDYKSGEKEPASEKDCNDIKVALKQTRSLKDVRKPKGLWSMLMELIRKFLAKFGIKV